MQMASSHLSEVVQHLRRAVLPGEGAGRTDGQLLECFLNQRDTAALAALVRRHGPMVWGVCRRLLRSHHDAEDAFQATFLILVRKAASIRSHELVANWLYGVAHQTALKARATTARRRERERQVTAMPEPVAAGSDCGGDLQALLDQELSRLPDKYRVVIVLCDLEGKTRKEAARQLGLPEGTLASRLARARAMLARRLTRQGLVFSGGALAEALAQNALATAVPTSVVTSTIQAASLVTAGRSAVTGVISVKVTAVIEGVLKTMLLKNFKIASVVLLVIVAAASAGGLLSLKGEAEPAIPQVETKKQAPEKKAIGEKPVDKKEKEAQPAQAEERRREKERLAIEEEKKKIEHEKLRELFGNGKVDVFLDSDMQKPFIKGAKFDSTVEMSGRKFLQFIRVNDEKLERLLIDPTRITGLRITN
jgi:RNA polymerase sigma factor (sigma-70 family)